MTDGDDTGTGSTPGPDDVGSVSEEAAKLLGAFSGWARSQGHDLGNGLGDLAAGAQRAAHDVNEHLATGASECTMCPICRTVHVVRELSPEVKQHLATASASLMQAAAALMATAVPDETRKPSSDDVEHIDLDNDWPED
ncbi:hypothetical protein ncot_06635 [Nocardioides sp. JQ2195]|uniref:hypothetical protein n=1 Tax=Nocardioides sp. JQ2195 TaxID=2592334 RepID=UPI00143E279B|nr:hypothetical protein [Nocardioides sp. JQ2195]QIX26315.1 hypothetical protein ncot_06635 [Nocardioides sp. JQ2195]